MPQRHLQTSMRSIKIVLLCCITVCNFIPTYHLGQLKWKQLLPGQEPLQELDHSILVASPSVLRLAQLNKSISARYKALKIEEQMLFIILFGSIRSALVSEAAKVE